MGAMLVNAFALIRFFFFVFLVPIRSPDTLLIHLFCIQFSIHLTTHHPDKRRSSLHLSSNPMLRFIHVCFCLRVSAVHDRGAVRMKWKGGEFISIPFVGLFVCIWEIESLQFSMCNQYANIILLLPLTVPGSSPLLATWNCCFWWLHLKGCTCCRLYRRKWVKSKNHQRKRLWDEA